MVADCRDKKQVTRYRAKEPPRFVCEKDPEKKAFSFKTTSLCHMAKIMHTVTHKILSIRPP